MKRLKLWGYALFGVCVILLAVIPFIIGFLLNPIIVGFKAGYNKMNDLIDKAEFILKRNS